MAVIRNERRAELSVVRDSVEHHFEHSEANGVSILPNGRDARYARPACGGKFGSTESRPTTINFGT